MVIEFDAIKKEFGKKAEAYAHDKEKLGHLLGEAVKKAKKIGPFEAIWDNLQLLFGIVRDWMSGEYKEVPTGSIILIIIGLLYFVSPIDLILDFLPGGLIDDAVVLGFIIKQIMSDLDNYKQWREEKMKTESEK